MVLNVYLDESGDHGLDNFEKSFPVFALALFVCDQDHYIDRVVPSVVRLKHEFCGHEGVILHSRDIRKWQKGFECLADPAMREAFYSQLNALMATLDYTLICAVIKKIEHKATYGKHANEPYGLALTLAMERLLPLMEAAGQDTVTLYAEARGKNEDKTLDARFRQIASYGTSFIRGERFQRIGWDIKFIPKMGNVIGTQLADLAAYPTARHVMHPERPNPAYEIIESKFYVGKGNIRGLKSFP